MTWLNDLIIEYAKTEDDNEDEHEKRHKNEGTLILDATCIPQDIRFPTDVSLLNEARLDAESVIDVFDK